jgi:transcriptional regulator with XRE-family HTH domain
MKRNPHPTDQHVGSRIRMRRLMLRKSQTDLAKALGITFQQVQKYEKGANRVSASRLQQISLFLEVPVPFFFEGLPVRSEKTDQAGYAHHVAEFLSTSEGIALIKAFMALKRLELRRSVVRFVEDLAKTRD